MNFEEQIKTLQEQLDISKTIRENQKTYQLPNPLYVNSPFGARINLSEDFYNAGSRDPYRWGY